MRRALIAAAAGTALLCLAPFGAAAASAHPSGTNSRAVHRIVVRPVTSTGHAVRGYTVTKVKDSSPIDCSYPSPSVAAVDDNILECSPDAAYAVACWRAAKAHHVLCLDSGLSNQLTRFRTSGTIAHAKALHRRGPLTLVLADGTKCGIRNGGAGASLKHHPDYGVTYYCQQGQAVWAPLKTKDYGIHRNGHVWTVKVGADNGTSTLRTVRVARAYLVGTA